ncbi:MAG: bacterial Ig-like domain-containing protein [Treponema sp.]|nr:bacterial Ig-like domain-containing protein [Treponema sp.]
MKKIRFVKALFAALALTLAIPGCSDFDGTEDTGIVQTKDNKIALKISVGNGYERTALPGEIDLSSYTYKLEATASGATTATALTGDTPIAYSKLIGATTIYISEGTYSFTLTAYNGETAVLAGTVSKTISATSNALAFKLFAQTSSTATGNVNITVRVPDDYGVADIKAALYESDDVEEPVARTVTLTKDSSDKITGATITGTVPAGQSRMEISLLSADKDSAGKFIVLGSEIIPVYAVAGITSTDSIDVQVLQYKATVTVTTKDTTAPTITLKNASVANAAAINLTTTSTASPFAYSGYVPVGTYNVFVGENPHGSLDNVTTLAVDTSVTLQSISAAWKNGTQPVFYLGTDEDDILEALTVTGSYKDSDNNPSTQTITSGCSLSGYDKTKETQTVKVTYSGKESAEFTVTLTPITVASIAIKSAPAKLVYKLGETLDLTGLVITPTMNNGTTGTDVAYSDTTKDDFAASGFVSTAVAATKTVTVTYKNIATATATFNAKIIALAGLEITTPPTKTTGYKSTDTALDLAGMVVTATYTDDTPEGVGLYATDVTNKVTLSKPDFTSSGEQTITVTYKEGSGDLQKTATDSFKITVLHDYAQKMTLDFTGSSPAGKAWNGVPIRGSGNVAALVTRAEGSYAGYLGRKFWLVGGVFAEYCNSAAGLGYTNSEKDTAHTSTDFVKAIESEAITGPFKLTVKTSAKEREFRIYVSSDKTALWTSNPVVAENLNANSGTHTFEYTETTPMYIGIGTLPASDKTVYTSISSIILETDTEIPADKFPVTSIAFTNDAINEGKLSLSKDVFAEAGTSGYQLTAEITPAYATDNTYTFAYTTEATSSHISVSEAGVITLTDADNMNVNETGTITVTANGGTNVKASIELTVVAQVDDATKIETTRKQLEEAFNGTSSTFEYGSVATAATNATTLINTLKLTYKNDVTITPNVDETTGKLTLTISISGSSAENAIVEYAYTEALAQAAVKTAVSQIKKGSAEGFTWNTDAATTASKIREEIAKITLTDATATVSATDSETVVVAVTSTIIATVKDETIVVSSPNILAGAYNISTNAVEGYSVDGVSGGKWSKQTAGSGVSQTHDKITITASIDSNGANLKNKDSNVGYMTFTIGRTMNFVFTDPAEKGIEIFSANGSSLGKYGATGSETSVTLSAGTYIIYGATTSSAKIKTVKFTEVTGAGVTGDLSDIPTAEKDITLTVSGNVVAVGNVSDTAQNVSYVWYVNNVKVSGESSATFTLPSSSVIGETYIVRATVTIDGVTYTKTVSVMYE